MTQQTKDALLAAMGAAELQVTPEFVDSMIKEKTFVLQPCKTVMVCTLTLHNGFRLFGYNTCLDVTKFDLKEGEERSFNEARNQAFAFAAYQLLEDHYRGNAPLSNEQRKLPEHIQLVIREFYQLHARLAGVTAFLDQFSTLDEKAAAESGVAAEEVIDLKIQQELMSKTAEVLRRRLERAGV